MSRAPSSLAARLAVALDHSLERPLFQQLAEFVWTEIIDGTLEPGERLPTVRELAVELGLHPRVVERGFADLEQRGVVRVEAGGTFVCLQDTDPATLERARALDELCAEASARAEQLGYGLDELIEALTQLRLDRKSRERP
jgi:GntR family transcriptional regulator